MSGWIRCDAPQPLAAHDRALAEPLLRHLAGVSQMRWATLRRFTDADADIIDVERGVHAIWSAGLVERRERRDRRGDTRPTALRITERGRRRLDGWQAERASHDAASRLIEALHRLARDPDALPVPKRVLVLEAFGATKAVRIEDHRAAIEAAFDAPLDTLVQDWTTAVLTAGPAGFRFGGHGIDLGMSAPWYAITGPVADRLDGLWTTASEVITIENLAPFEGLAMQGGFTDAVGVFTSGFLRRAQRRWVSRLAKLPGVTRVRHWGDLDAGGLLIVRQLRDLLREHAPDVELIPWRMEPALLDEHPTRPLTAHDRRRLARYLDDPENPLLDLAQALLDRGCKLEQEALMLSRDWGEYQPGGDR